MADWRDRLRRELAIKKAEEGIKITQLSEQLGFSRDYISRLLKPTSNPSLRNLKVVCEALNLSFVEIYTGAKDHAVYDEVIGQVSELTQNQLSALRDHIRQSPVYSESEAGDKKEGDA